MKVLILLWYEFFKTGLFAIGGGMATLPFLMDIANRYPWFTVAELMDMIAISESTPGAIGINMATYVGYTTAGIFGGVVATVALVTPSIIIITLISKFMSKFNEHRLVRHGFYGLRPATSGLIAGAMVEVFKVSFLNLTNGFSFANILGILNFRAIGLYIILLFGIMKFKKVHPIVFIVIGAIVGITLGV